MRLFSFHRPAFRRIAALLLVGAALPATLTAAEPRSTPFAAEPRSEEHAQYAARLWEFLQSEATGYRTWTVADEPLSLPYGPEAPAHGITYINRVAADSPTWPAGSTLVTEHRADADGEPLGITVRYRQTDGYDSANGDWYWAHFTPDGNLVRASVDRKRPWDKRNFLVVEKDGRLWILRIGTPELAEFVAAGGLARHVVLPGAGPGGMTLRSPDLSVILEYLADKPGFKTFVKQERVWVFREAAPELEEWYRTGSLVKHVARPGAGPNRATLRAPDSETLDEYAAAKPGFHVKAEDGRVWVFEEGSSELADFLAQGNPVRQVIRPGAGPGGLTLRSAESETITRYLTSLPGFETAIRDGRLWVFRSGSPEHAEFLEKGEPAKSVTRPGAGPDGISLRAVDAETLDAYLLGLRATGLEL